MKCKRCGKEMEFLNYNGEEYWVCHDCRVKKKVHYEESPAHLDKVQPAKTKQKDRSISLSHVEGIKGIGN